MSLIKKRPSLGLMVPRNIRTGLPFRVQALVDCNRQTPVDAIILELRGHIVHFTQSQYGQHRNEECFMRARAVVSGERELRVGRHEFAASFEIPSELPATYPGEHLRIEYSLEVHVDIPWWPDARSTYMLAVEADPTRVTPPLPQTVFVSDTEGPRRNKPYFELSLATRDIEPGSELVGSVSLANTEHNRYRLLVLQLEARERYRGMLAPTDAVRSLGRWTLPLDRAEEEQPMHFKIRLPSVGVVPGFTLHNASVAWQLDVRVDIERALDVRRVIPLQIRRGAVAPDADEELVPLVVGTDRIARIWESVAAATAYTHEHGRLVSRVDNCDILIDRIHPAGGAAAVRGTIRYTDRGLGLEGSRDGIRCRDRDHRVAIDDAIGEPANRAFIETIDDLHAVGVLANPGLDAKSLRAFAVALEHLAAALARCCETLPPPAALRGEREAWQRTAKAVDGSLTESRMAISGRRSDIAFEIRPVWHAERSEVAALECIVRPPVVIPSRHHRLWRREEPVDPETRDLGLDSALEHADALHIDGSVLRALIGDPKPDGAIPVLEGLIAAARRLSGSVGPYR